MFSIAQTKIVWKIHIKSLGNTSALFAKKFLVKNETNINIQQTMKPIQQIIKLINILTNYFLTTKIEKKSGKILKHLKNENLGREICNRTSFVFLSNKLFNQKYKII